MNLEQLLTELKAGRMYQIQGAQYIVSGTLRNGRKFRRTYFNAREALSINLWNGKVLVKYPGMTRARTFQETHN